MRRSRIIKDIRVCPWGSIETGERQFGLQIKHNGKWHHCCENGAVLLFPTERQAADRGFELHRARALTANTGAPDA